MMPMTDDDLAEIEAEFCPAPGVIREPSHGVPALVAEVRRLRAIVAERAKPTCRFYMLAGDAVLVSDGAWRIERGPDGACDVLCLATGDGGEERHDVIAGQDVRWNHGVFAAFAGRAAFFVDMSKRVPAPASAAESAPDARANAEGFKAELTAAHALIATLSGKVDELSTRDAERTRTMQRLHEVFEFLNDRPFDVVVAVRGLYSAHEAVLKERNDLRKQRDEARAISDQVARERDALRVERDGAVANASLWEDIARERKTELDGWRSDCARLSVALDRALPLTAPRDGIVAAEEIQEGDAVVMKIGGVAGVARRRPPSPFEGVTVCPSDDAGGST